MSERHGFVRRLTRLCQKTLLYRGGLGFVCRKGHAALSERTQLCRKGCVCMCRGGCGFFGEDTTLSKSMRLCCFWRGFDFVREEVVLLTLIRTHYRNLIRKTKLYFSNRTSRAHIVIVELSNQIFSELTKKNRQSLPINGLTSTSSSSQRKKGKY